MSEQPCARTIQRDPHDPHAWRNGIEVTYEVDCPGYTKGDVVVGSRWHRRPPGREVVEVQRVWMFGHPFPELTVRAHPITGGRPVVAPVKWLREHYTEEPQA